MSFFHRICTVGVYVISCWMTWGCTPPLPEQPDYGEHIAPILEHHCARCHHEGRATANVALDRSEHLLLNQLAVVCSSVHPDERGGLDSEDICDAIEVPAMPPGAIPRLSRHEQRLLVRWFEQEASP